MMVRWIPVFLSLRKGGPTPGLRPRKAGRMAGQSVLQDNTPTKAVSLHGFCGFQQ